MPFFTIITSTYNAASTLPRLAESLAVQTCRDFEWVVQDGASQDATDSIIEQWQERIPISYESRKDGGIYDAWNLAIARAGSNLGQWVLFVGGDDLLYSPTCLEEVKTYLRTLDCTKKFCAAGMQFVYKDGSVKSLPANNVESMEKFSAQMSFRHPALFHHASLFDSERFDTTFKIAGDYAFLRRNLHPNNTAETSTFVTLMHEGGCSSSPETFFLLMRENARILSSHFDVFDINATKTLVLCYRMICIISLKNTLLKTRVGGGILGIYSKLKEILFSRPSRFS